MTDEALLAGTSVKGPMVVVGLSSRRPPALVIASIVWTIKYITFIYHAFILLVLLAVSSYESFLHNYRVLRGL